MALQEKTEFGVQIRIGRRQRRLATSDTELHTSRYPDSDLVPESARQLSTNSSSKMNGSPLSKQNEVKKHLQWPEATRQSMHGIHKICVRCVNHPSECAYISICTLLYTRLPRCLVPKSYQTMARQLLVAGKEDANWIVNIEHVPDIANQCSMLLLASLAIRPSFDSSEMLWWQCATFCKKGFSNGVWRITLTRTPCEIIWW